MTQAESASTWGVLTIASQPGVEGGGAPALGGPSPSGPAVQGVTPGGTTPLTGGGGGAAPAQPGGSILWMMLPVIGIMFLYTIMSSRKDKRKRAELMNAMGRGDTVQTIGGAIGTITELRDNEVVVRFEDGRVRFVKSAIQSVVKSAKNKDSSAIESKDVRNGAREAAGSEV